MRRDVPLGGQSERDLLSCCRFFPSPYRASIGDRINTVQTKLSRVLRLLARFSKANRVRRPQPHFVRLAGDLVPKHP
jgi:hypothetical protein